MTQPGENVAHERELSAEELAAREEMYRRTIGSFATIDPMSFNVGFLAYHEWLKERSER